MRHLAVVALLSFLTSEVGLAQKKKTRRATRARAVEAAVVYDPAKINDPNVATQLEAKPLAMLRAQILLDRANISPGEIDGQPGANFKRAVQMFQTARKLTPSGELDEATWGALNADTAPAVVPYRITDTDVAGPFQAIPEDMMEQSKLPTLGFANEAEALGEQFHVGPILLQKMNPGKTFKAGEEVNVPNVLGTVTGKAARITVKKAGILTAYDAEGNIIASYPCSSGSEHDPLPIGKWKINGVAKNPPFHYNPQLFWDADPSHSKAKIPPGPNNPVGVVWIDLSKEHYGIHGTPNPSKVGHTQSHGCIRLTNWDAMELAGLVGPGTPALLEE